MSKITVRTILAAILENNMQMDDGIDFTLSDETTEIGRGQYWKISLARTGTYTIKGNPAKTLEFVFDLHEANEEE